MARFWTRLLPFVSVMAIAGWACSPRTSTSSIDIAAAGEDADVAAVSDAVPIVDVPGPQADVADVADPTDVSDVAGAIAIDAADAVGTDVNYMPDLGPCGWKDLVITPDTAPSGASCSPACPPGYPCTCGDCPWVQTPPMKQPRMGATAVWTGKEVVVFGGSKEEFLGGQVYQWSAERWNPKTGKGFEYISIPPINAPFDKLLTHWDGSKVWVVTQRLEKGGTDHSFVWDPATNQSTPLKWKNRPYSLWSSLKVWVGGKILEWGYRTVPGNWGMPYFIPSKDDFEVSLYDPATDTWQPQPLPPIKGEPALPSPGCAVASGDDVYFFAPPDGHAWSDDLTRVYRFHVPTAAWSELPPMPTDPGREACHERGFVHGEPNGLVAWGQKTFSDVYGSLGPVVGVRYDKSTNAWTILPELPGAEPYGTDWASGYLAGKIHVYGLLFKSNKQHPKYPSFFRLSLDDATWMPMTAVGFPKDGRTEGTVAVTDSEFMYLGGINGPCCTNVIHADGVRIPLSALGVKTP